MLALNNQVFEDNDERLKRILIAHSNAVVAEWLATRLRTAGFFAWIADSGIGCFHAMDRHTPDLLLLDPNLLWGGADGVLELMEQDKILLKVPVVLLEMAGGKQRLGRLSRLATLRVPDSRDDLADQCIAYLTKLMETKTAGRFQAILNHQLSRYWDQDDWFSRKI
jgi:CheY-like chemotaxis protein